MKPTCPAKQGQAGSVLMVSLCTALVLGILLAGYMVYTQTQNISVMKSQSWNAAIVVAEAGVEEALSHLNRNAPYFDPVEGTNNLACNGWTNLGGNRYGCPRRFLGQNYYDVTITLVGLTPIIESVGYVYEAGLYGSAPRIMFASAGVQVPAGYQARRIRTFTKIDSLFAVAMAARSRIDLNGFNVNTDSFDSADPNFSDNGRYPTNNVNKTRDNGDVATNGEIINTLDVGNAKVKGKVKTGPGGTIRIGPQGSVGSRAWVEGGNRGIQPGWSANDMNVVFPPVGLPNTTWLPKSRDNKKIDGTQYDYVFTQSGDYEIGSGANILVTNGAHVRLRITGDFKMAGNDDIIRIMPGASLKIYMQGSSFQISGRGVVNETGNAASFYYFGLPSNTEIKFSGNASFTGAIYAPNADFTLGGGGNNTYDFVGASVTKTVKMNGHFNFHYDENLARIGSYRGFIPTLWTEN
ncbi:MAG: hypothetical protein RMH97_03915 [Verrucomicrobiales bacterium]|nr:hypothetical protein [Verrucomicrobiales bacterium]